MEIATEGVHTRLEDNGLFATAVYSAGTRRDGPRENIVLRSDDTLGKERETRYISTLGLTIDRSSSRCCRSLRKSAAIYFLYVAARREDCV